MASSSDHQLASTSIASCSRLFKDRNVLKQSSKRGGTGHSETENRIKKARGVGSKENKRQGWISAEIEKRKLDRGNDRHPEH